MFYIWFKRLPNFVFGFIALALLCRNTALGDPLAKTPVGLFGCFLIDSAVSSDGSVVLSACNASPNGIYYSVDFGSTWTLAAGGDYSVGVGIAVETGTQFAYSIATVANLPKVFRAELPSVPGSWTPDWQEIQLASGFATAMAASGDKLYVITQTGTVYVVDGTTGTTLQTTTLPETEFGRKSIALSSDAIYITDTASGSDKLFKASLAGDKTIQTLSPLSTLPAGATPDEVFVAPNGTIYVSSDGADSGVFASTDAGASFSEVSNGVVYSACFSGSTYILGTQFSTNSGGSFTTLVTGRTSSGSVRFDDKACVIHPSDSNKVLLGTTRGFFKTTEFNSNADPLWSDATSGQRALTVNALAQSAASKERVVVSTNGGLAFSSNFTDPTPIFEFSCLGSDCTGGQGVAADITDPNIFYVASGVAGTIFKGTVSTASEPNTISYTSFINSPTDFGSIKTSAFLPQQLIVGHYSFTNGVPNGGLFFYDTATGQELKTALSGKPVRDVAIVSAGIIFAVVGFANDPAPSAETRGIFFSNDAGTTFSRVSDGDLGAETFFSHLVYDEVQDVLYALSTQSITTPSESSVVYYLKKASAGGTDWKAARGTITLPLFNVLPLSAIAVDPVQAKVYVATSGHVLSSNDLGTTWIQIAEGVPGEETYVLFFDALLEGASTGLSSIQERSCGISGPQRRVPKGKRVRFKYTYDGTETSGKLQARRDESKRWSKLREIAIKNGAASVRYSLKKTQLYRILIDDCSTLAIKGRVKG